MELMTTLGLVAGTLTTLAYLLQVLKTWRSRAADGMSWSMLITLCLGILLWLVYGFYAQDMPVIVANLFTLLFSSAILAMKIRYEAVPKLPLSPSRTLFRLSAALEPKVSSDLMLAPEITFIQPESEPSSPVA